MHPLKKHNQRNVRKTYTPHKVAAAPANHWGPQWLCPELLRENGQHLLPQSVQHLPPSVFLEARNCCVRSKRNAWMRRVSNGQQIEGRRICPGRKRLHCNTSTTHIHERYRLCSVIIFPMQQPLPILGYHYTQCHTDRHIQIRSLWTQDEVK